MLLVFFFRLSDFSFHSRFVVTLSHDPFFFGERDGWRWDEMRCSGGICGDGFVGFGEIC
jgi:hypothetical protein